MYERCLVPIDGSDLSYRALKEAIKILNVPQGRVRLVYVVAELLTSRAQGFVGTQSWQEWIRTEAKNALVKAEALARELGVQTESALLEAKGQRIATVIVEDAKRWPAEVIVMATHGRSGFDHLMFGSVAEGVLRTVTLPILLVRGE
jgi:nucleotide-binding universal stress UspA family protein